MNPVKTIYIWEFFEQFENTGSRKMFLNESETIFSRYMISMFSLYYYISL